ncbi:Hypothetical predicted protein [Olea europaea subsp. europaea]|uniref:Uncharacterized protein n=1 Tax=Olea europaea subsp. europaea TaxID=158383 RepID=A0A8S0SE71_OLEEU|nr:Hypothetical predicted protein [Olea europaea subsp. europaea]
MPSTYHALASVPHSKKKQKIENFSNPQSSSSTMIPRHSSRRQLLWQARHSPPLIRPSRPRSLVPQSSNAPEENRCIPVGEDSKLELLKIEALCRSRSVLNDSDDTFTVVATVTASLPKKRN